MADKNMKAKINVEFEEAASRQQINSGEDISTLFGKIRKFLADLKAVAFSGAYSDLSGTPDLTQYASKAKYGDTTINVGRKAGTTVGEYSTAEGKDTTAMGNYSHSEGVETSASGAASHAEGYSTYAVGYDSHSGGYATTARGNISFAHGYHVISKNDYEIALGKCNVSTDNSTLFSVGNGTDENNRHNAFEITTTGGKLHDKDIATTDMSLKANGGNADTVGGKSADDFSQIINLGDNQTDTKNAIGSWGKTTIYRCTNWTDFPAESPDGQGIVISMSHGGTGTAGIDPMWVTQFFIPANSGVVYKRYIGNTTVGNWCGIYSADNKPYVTGSFSGTAGGFHFDYAPSFAIVNDEGNIKFGYINALSVGGSERGYDVNFSGLSDTTHEYIIFK